MSSFELVGYFKKRREEVKRLSETAGSPATRVLCLKKAKESNFQESLKMQKASVGEVVTKPRLNLFTASFVARSHREDAFFCFIQLFPKKPYFLFPEIVMVAIVGAFPAAIEHSPFPSSP